VIVEYDPSSGYIFYIALIFVGIFLLLLILFGYKRYNKEVKAEYKEWLRNN
jgi:cbb3-type cytochrome oxidase subunit 3